MKGLIIKPKWADLILDGEKLIEIRGRNTTIRGTIGIIKSKTKKVFGTAELFASIELTKKDYEKLWHRHRLTILWDELIKTYSKPYAWFMLEPKRYDEPIDYVHKQGCVVWVNL